MRFVLILLFVIGASADELPLGPGRAAHLFPLPDNFQDASSGLPDPDGYAHLLEKVTPAVVSVFPALQLEVGAEQPLERFFGAGGEGGDDGRRVLGVGSGVVISDDGWIVTNSHVVHLPSGKIADAIGIEFPDHRRLDATIVGVDPATDLALLKIDAPTPVYLPFGHSDHVRPGDLVFAIGNPFRIGITATMGMVSATGRSNLGINGAAGYESFIQTDAAINPGNSGGALIDSRGRLVGINTAIWGSIGGNVGIGFAIPTRLVQHVVVCLAEEGEVRRGFFGWNLSEVGEAEAAAAGSSTVRGAHLMEVMADGPAAEAGLLAGDVIIEAAERAVDSPSDLRCEMSMVKPGESLEVTYLRAGESRRAVVTGAARAAAHGSSFELARWPGVRFIQLEAQLTIESVDDKATADGLAEGMQITAVNGLAVEDRAGLESALRRGINKVATRMNRVDGTLAIRLD